MTRLQAEHELNEECAVIDSGAFRPHQLVSKMQDQSMLSARSNIGPARRAFLIRSFGAECP